MSAVQRVVAPGFGRTPVLAYLTDEATTDLVCRVVPGGRRGVEVHDGGVAAALASIQSGAVAEMLLVDITGSAAPAADMAALAAICGPGSTILAIGPDNDVGLYRALLAAGASDYLVKPLVAQELRRTILTTNRTEQAAVMAARLGRILVVVGARGGVGSSTVATAIACLVADDFKKSVALIDLDIHFGTAALALDIQPGSGLRNALNAPDRIDGLFIASALVKCGERLHVMSGEEAVDEALHIRPEALDRLVAEARPSFDVVVIDLPRHLLAAAAPVLARAHGLAVVADMSLAALRDTLRIRAGLERVAPTLKPVVVANRIGSQKTGQLSAAEFERGLGAKIDVRISEDARAAKAGLNGKPVAVAAFRAVAQALGATDTPVQARTWFGLRK